MLAGLPSLECIDDWQQSEKRGKETKPMVASVFFFEFIHEEEAMSNATVALHTYSCALDGCHQNYQVIPMADIAFFKFHLFCFLVVI